jgi:sugar phosphate isomerase/epimerase
MRLGCCGGIEQAELVHAAGFDFLEVNVQAVLQGDLPDEQWRATAPDPAKLPLPIEAANCLVPGNHPLVGPKRDLAGLKAYMQRVAERAQRLGISRLVFGSGSARRRPDDMTPDAAVAQLAQFASLAGEICARHGIVLVIEHLNAGETNTLNKLAQTMNLCDDVASPHVGVLVDSYHYALESEKDEAILRLGDRVRHVHVAEPEGRVQPGAYNRPAPGSPGSPGSPGTLGTAPKPYDFELFFSLLQKIGYSERVSVESSWTGALGVAGPASVAYLRRCWDAAAACASGLNEPRP